MSETGITASIGVLAAEFGVSRDVLRRILAESAVAPVGKRGGHPIYRLRDVYRAVQAQNADPDQMNPHARLALARAIKVEDEIRTRRGELIELLEHERRIGHLAKLTVQMAETLPDRLERDAGLAPAQVAAAEAHIDAWRTDVYEQWVATDERD